ncbi:MAG TPA: tape measure protein, partial [Corynebacterium sp.]|nr:tape measure protein [Corynebacterium sp.]
LGDELDRAGREAAELASSSGPSALNGALGGLASTVKGLLPQITAVATAGTVISKGWDRLTGIDTATFKLKGLGHEAGSVSDIMDSALTSVKGTAFGLGDAATAAANAVASGVKPGAELTQVLTTMADTAAISGASLQDMGMIFNSVMAKGKLQGDDLLQLMGRGVPVLQMIGDQLGITAAEVSKLATDGAISFEIFEAAMREGVGGAAQAMGGSIEGSMQNAGAAVGRLGEALMKVAAEEGPSVIAGFTQSINLLTTAVNGAYGAWEKVPGPVKAVVAALTAAKIAQVLLNTEMANGLRIKITDHFTSTAKGITDFTSALGEAYRNTRAANPEMGALSSGMSALAGSGGVAATAMTGLKGAAGGLLSALGGPWGLAIGGATVALGLFMKHVQD